MQDSPGAEFATFAQARINRHPFGSGMGSPNSLAVSIHKRVLSAAESTFLRGAVHDASGGSGTSAMPVSPDCRMRFPPPRLQGGGSGLAKELVAGKETYEARGDRRLNSPFDKTFHPRFPAVSHPTPKILPLQQFYRGGRPPVTLLACVLRAACSW